MICVRMMHIMQIIHKDIKPANIIYSKTYNKVVLIDYGISHIVKQQQGYLSKTYL